MKKIVLLDFVFDKSQRSEPLGISYIKSYLEDKGLANVEIISPTSQDLSINDVIKLIDEKKVDILGISIIDHIPTKAQCFIEQLKRNNPNTIVVIGGHSPSINPSEFLFDEVKAVFIGEGEESFYLFLQNIFSKKGIDNIPGIAFKKKDRLVINKPLPKREDLDSYPFMARDILIEQKKRYGINLSAQIISSRGCYMNCHYCSIKKFSSLQKGRAYRERSVVSIASEIISIYKDIGIKSFVFEDANFIPPNYKLAKQKVKMLCNLLLHEDLDQLCLYLQFRPDNLYIDLIKMLQLVGLKGVSMGIESINQQDLDFYGRISDVSKIPNILKLLQSIGFCCNINSQYRVRLGYIMFNPYSTKDLLFQSYKFLLENEITPKKLITYLIPFRNTIIHEKLKKANLLAGNNMFRFVSDDIREIFIVITEIINKIMVFRERLRVPSKYKIVYKYPFDDSLIDKSRQRLDELCYYAFQELINSEKKYYSILKKAIFKKLNNEIDFIIADLEKIEEEMNIIHEKQGLFRL